MLEEFHQLIAELVFAVDDGDLAGCCTGLGECLNGSGDVRLFGQFTFVDAQFGQNVNAFQFFFIGDQVFGEVVELVDESLLVLFDQSFCCIENRLHTAVILGEHHAAQVCFVAMGQR